MDMTCGVYLTLPTVESARPLDESEATLNNEIKSLWSAHQIGRATAKRTKQELKILRLDLGAKLCEMKAILVRAGRSGGWAAYLRSQDLPRATAERYIGRVEVLSNPNQIEPRETISEPTAEDVRRLVRSLMPRLRRVLKTPAWMEWFTVEVQYQWESADASSTAVRVDEAEVVPGDSGGPSKTVVLALTPAA
jgi:hypothetical protein